MSKGKKKVNTKEIAELENNNVEKEIKDITIKNLLMIDRFLVFDAKKSIENKEITTYTIEYPELLRPVDSIFISEQYENLVLMSKYSHLYEGDIGKLRFIIAGLIPKLDKFRYKSNEELLSINKRIYEFLDEVLDYMTYVLESNKKELTIKNEDDFYNELLNFVVGKATEKNLSDILEFSCEEIFSHSQDKKNRLIFVRKLTSSNYDEVVDKLTDELKVCRCVAHDSINIIGDLLLTPPRFLLSDGNKYEADIKTPQYSISVVKNLNWFLWENCNEEEDRYYFNGDNGRFRYCLQILIDRIADNYREIPVDKIDEVIDMHKKIHNILSAVNDAVSSYESDLYSFNQLSIFVCSLMSEYHFLEPILEFLHWCGSPYLEWETDYDIKQWE